MTDRLLRSEAANTNISLADVGFHIRFGAERKDSNARAFA